jgi:hypothetical protein
MAGTVTPLSARSQRLVTTALVFMAAMGLVPLFDVVAQRWPLAISSLSWRYDTVSLIVSIEPQLVILSGLIGIIGAVTANRLVIRLVALVLGVIAAVTIVALVPLIILDYLQYLNLIPPSRMTAFKVNGMKTLAVALAVAVSAAVSAAVAWRVGMSENAGARRQKGQGLVVGQRGEVPEN